MEDIRWNTRWRTKTQNRHPVSNTIEVQFTIQQNLSSKWLPNRTLSTEPTDHLTMMTPVLDRDEPHDHATDWASLSSGQLHGFTKTHKIHTSHPLINMTWNKKVWHKNSTVCQKNLTHHTETHADAKYLILLYSLFFLISFLLLVSLISNHLFCSPLLAIIYCVLVID